MAVEKEFIRSCERDSQDSWRWTGSSKGDYNTRDVYSVLLQNRGVGQIDRVREEGFKLI